MGLPTRRVIPIPSLAPERIVAVDRALLTAAAFGVAVALLLVIKARMDLRIYKQRYRWTDEDIQDARRDAVSRSRSTVSGKVQEHLAPLFPEFCAEFNARDARFLGSPVDFVIFDGLDAGGVTSIVFLEVKTGRSTLSLRERQVRDAVDLGKVEWRELRLGGLLIPSDPLQPGG